MLFRKDMEKRCAYCTHAAPIGDDKMACEKQGVVPEGYSCRKFIYDPLKRTPPRPLAPDFRKYDKTDFSL